MPATGANVTDGTVNNDTINDLYERTARLTSHELVRRLNTHLGATLVATLSGVKDRKLPYKWATASGPVPRPEALQRLQVAHRVWNLITSSESDHVTRSWFIGLNPRLGEEAPAMALREGKLADVQAAALAFIEGVDE